MWYTWATLLLVSSALVTAEIGAGAVEVETTAPAPSEQTAETAVDTTSATQAPEHDSAAAEARVAVATTRAPPRTLDRQAAELAWRSWLQSAESGNQNAPPRRITTKSLFITPLVCPKGQRLDRNGCVQVVTVNKDEHERILLEQLNALFSSPSSGDVLYDYGDDEPGPLQLSIPIGLDPQAQPLQNQEPAAQAQELQPNYVKIDKKDEHTNSDLSIEAELELLKLQTSKNNTDSSDVLNHNVMNTLQHYADKPKRDSPVNNSAETHTNNNDTDLGQKELVYGHVNVDPVLYNIENENTKDSSSSFELSEHEIQPKDTALRVTTNNGSNTTEITKKLDETSNTTKELHKDQTKLNPENDYSDIGEAIKLISRYAEVSTDDNYSKDQKKHASKEDSILGTRTKLQYRRNKPKDETQEPLPIHTGVETSLDEKMPQNSFYLKNEAYFRYPWTSQHSQTPPPNYPFRHLQDYWPGRNHVGGVYNTHGNPRRHHHSYPHYFRPHAYVPEAYPGLQDMYPDQFQAYSHKVVQRHTKPVRSQINNQGLYSLLGLRHWFSSEGTSKR